MRWLPAAGQGELHSANGSYHEQHAKGSQGVDESREVEDSLPDR